MYVHTTVVCEGGAGRPKKTSCPALYAVKLSEFQAEAARTCERETNTSCCNMLHASDSNCISAFEERTKAPHHVTHMNIVTLLLSKPFAAP